MKRLFICLDRGKIRATLVLDKDEPFNECAAFMSNKETDQYKVITLNSLEGIAKFFQLSYAACSEDKYLVNEFSALDTPTKHKDD